MRIVLYTHSLVSDWNHGNAHFLRGVLRELQARGHERWRWSRRMAGAAATCSQAMARAALTRFHQCFPELPVSTYGSGLRSRGRRR